jgi:hypothetical protein
MRKAREKGRLTLRENRMRRNVRMLKREQMEWKKCGVGPGGRS